MSLGEGLLINTAINDVTRGGSIKELSYEYHNLINRPPQGRTNRFLVGGGGWTDSAKAPPAPCSYAYGPPPVTSLIAVFINEFRTQLTYGWHIYRPLVSFPDQYWGWD